MGQHFGNVGVLSLRHVRASPTQVGGCVDPTAIANNFASYFSEVYAPNNRNRASSLYNVYISLRENYFGLPLAADLAFDTELVSKITLELKTGKAPDTNGLTAEHKRILYSKSPWVNFFS